MSIPLITNCRVWTVSVRVNCTVRRYILPVLYAGALQELKFTADLRCRLAAWIATDAEIGRDPRDVVR